MGRAFTFLAYPLVLSDHGPTPATVWEGDDVGGDSTPPWVVRVLPDVVGIDKLFDYVVPDGVAVHVGDVVRIDLHGRRVGGWIIALDVVPVPGVVLRPLAKVSGRGPAAELIDLAGWAAWRWAGRPAHLLRTASPSGVVRSLETATSTSPRAGRPATTTAAAPAPAADPTSASEKAAPGEVDTAIDLALNIDCGVLRLPPGTDRHRLVRAALARTVDKTTTDLEDERIGEEGEGPASLIRSSDPASTVICAKGPLRQSGQAHTYPRGPLATETTTAVETATTMAPGASGQTLVLCPSLEEARVLGSRLRREGVPTAILAADGPASASTAEWTLAASGAAQAVVGARAAAWAPAPHLARVLVLDEHDEAYQQEQAPTWHARDVVVERARRQEVPCLLVSACPTLEALGWGQLVTVGRGAERTGWGRIEVVDQRDLDPTLGPLFSPRLVDVVRGSGRVLCVLNRTGRVRLLACAACRTIARCEVCEAAVGLEETDQGPAELVCGRCGTGRPVVCTACGATTLKNLRLGVSKAREELEVLAGEPVVEVTAATPIDDAAATVARILVGTEAVLHRVSRADAVAFLDFDQQLLSLRWRAAEQALAMLARAARLVRRGSGRRGLILVQTRSPDHPALMAARHADPSRLASSELPLRRTLGLPPTTAMALVSGQAAEPFIAVLGAPEGVAVQGPVDGTWRLRSATHQTLCDALAATERPAGRLRIEVDPQGA